MDVGATTALVARVTLAAAFGLSAATKLAAPAGFARALREFGVPAPGAVARALPPVEAAVAVLLVTVRGSAWPAYLAIGVLVAFTGAVVANLAGGRPAPCPCFGPPGAGAPPVSAATVARNGALIALAVLGAASTEGASVGPALAASLVTVAVTLAVLRRVG
jgi:hypothetical protein